MVGAIVGSTRRDPHVVGKPSGFMLDDIAAACALPKARICMVGDRLDTDILFGKNGGLTTCLVLSGERGGAMWPCLAFLSSDSVQQKYSKVRYSVV
jgi:ribonucleotide monophosphatase NagD (HAD superfamily)